ncbi:hypothetical protein V5799_009861 [Amblyomma americanum]|uniref:Tudor domain-containing protein n=1 Tax=Amblyomma americanum TaxID=6943 RepID=A0AAQ4FAH3_AMBAM
MLTHVASEFHWLKLYLQRNYELSEHIMRYLEGLAPKLASKPGFMHQSQLPLGTPCFARYAENVWYRAVVSAWPRNDDTLVEVTFIDYGYLHVVSVAEVRQGNDAIFRTPPAAYECFLDELDLGILSPAAAEDLVSMARSIVQFQYVEVTVTIRREEQTQPHFMGPFVSIHLPDGRSLADMLRSAPVYRTAADLRQPLTFRCPTVKLGVPCSVYVAHAENMNRVFVHLATRDPMPYSDMIQEQCANAAPLDPSLVNVGTVCLARFSEDSLLYRSVVLECTGGACNVLFVDYGNCEIKSTKELLVIPPELLEEPAFALLCCAPGTGLECSKFLEVTKDRELSCTFSQGQPSGTYVAHFEGLNGNKPQPVAAAAGICGMASPKASNHIQIQRLKLDPGSRHSMFVTYIESAEVMYGQLKEMEWAVVQMSNDLEVESPSLAMIAPTDIAPGSAVACRYEQKWYRAEVIKPGPQTEVWLADYGDTTTVDISELRLLDLKYTLMPAYATKLTLDGFTCPPQNSDQVMAVLESLFLAYSLKADSVASVSIVSVLPNGTHSVQIFVGDPPKSVVRTLQSAIASSQPVSTAKVQSPTVCPVEKVLVTNVTPPNRFFGQFVRIPVEELDAFQQELMDHYSLTAPDPAFRPQPGDHVCCRFSEDGGFYRARVERASSDGSQYDVFYLDYGNNETVSSEDVRPLEPQFAVPSLFGIPCQLHSGEVSDTLVDSEVDVRLLACHGDVHSVAFGGSVQNPSKGPPAVVAPAQTSPRGDMNAFGSAPPCSAAAPTLVQLQLGPGSQEPATPVFVKSLSELYCQLLRNDDQLKGVSEVLESVANSLPVLPSAMRKVGTACCALYSEDGCWYRGIIQALQAGSVTVFFVDYGNSETVSDASIKQLPDSLALVPCQAVACRLKGATPTDAASATARLDDMIVEQEVTLKVHSCGLDKVHDVDIILSNGLNVLDQLVKEGLLISAGNPVAASQAPHVGGYQYPTLTEGVAVLVEIPWVLSPGEVYVKLVETSDALESLMDQLQSHYGSPGSAVANDVRPGQACVALYAEDGSWYRARVTHAKGGMLGVQYVDYGNCEEVSASSVRPILPKFAQLPAQAIRCRLRSVAPPGGGSTWPKLAPGGPLQHAFEGQFLCRAAAHSDGVHLVDLERPAGTPGPSLVETLVAGGFAMDATAMPRDLGSMSEASQGQRQLRAVIAPAEFSFQSMQYVDVKVTAVMSPSEVWCCLVEYVEPLTKALQEAGEAAPKFRNPVPGEACVARLPSPNKDEEGAGDEVLTPWARAVVRSRPSPAKLELFFVDMGGTRVVHHTEVKQIPAELTTQPGCAFQCVLSCNFPVDPVQLSAKILYKDLVLQVEQQLEPAKVIGSLFDTSGEDEVNVLDSFAPPPPPPPGAEPPVFEVEPVQDTEPAVEAEAAEADTAPPAVEPEVAVPEVTAGNPQVAAVKPEAAVVKPEETAAKPLPPPARTSPPWRSTQPHFIRGPIVPCYPPLSKISGKMLAMVMHVEDLSCFYLMPKDQESVMDGLSERLQTHYDETPEPVVEPLPRLPCVALYPNDNTWYRAKVVPDGSCVQFIDYGNVDFVPEIRAIAAEFLEVPPFCYKCKLDGAKDLADSSGVVEAFARMVCDKPVEVEVVTWGPEVAVKLSVDGEDVGTALQKFVSAETNTFESQETAEMKAPSAMAVSREAGVVSHVDALNSFYVQFSNRLGDLDVLGDKLQEEMASGSAAAVEAPDSNTLYAALYTEDGLWYRARVEGPGEGGSGLRVRFVDYGNMQTVESVVPLGSEDLQVEPFCVECQLAGINAIDNTSALVKFKELALESDVFVETVVPGKPLAVRLFTADGTDLLSQLPLPKRYSTTQVPLHQKVVVQISHVESATDFYVNLGDSFDSMEILAQQLLEVPQSDDMPVDTSLPCMVYWTDELPYRITVLKDKVEDAVEGPARALVKFVDYGNTDTVVRSNIRPLPDELVDVPMFAINCTLDDPEGKLGDEAMEKLQLLALSEPTTSLLAEFLEQRDGRYVVRLLDMGIDVLERLLQGAAQDASREYATTIVSSEVQNGSVLVASSETSKAPSEVTDIDGASSLNTECIDEGGDFNSIALAADVTNCNVMEDSAVEDDAEAEREIQAIKEDGLDQDEDSAVEDDAEAEREIQAIREDGLDQDEEPAVEDDAEAEREIQAIREDGLDQDEEPAHLAEALRDEVEAIKPDVKVEQSELEERTTEVPSSAVDLEDVVRNKAEHEKSDGSDKDQVAFAEEEVVPKDSEGLSDNLPAVTEADALPEEQEDYATNLVVVSEDSVLLKETEDKAAYLSAASKNDVLPEEPGFDEVNFSEPTEEHTLSEEVYEAAVYEDSVWDDDVNNGDADAPLEDTANVATAEGAISSTETQHVAASTEVTAESAGVEKDAQKPVDETSGHGPSEAKSLAGQTDSSLASSHVPATSSGGPCATPAVSEDTTTQEQQAAGTTGDDGAPPKSSSSTPEAGDAPSLTEREGADDNSAMGAVATSDFGAGGDAEPATASHSTVKESSPAASLRRSVGRMSLDDRPIPGVCLNAELLGAPSDT